LAVAYKVSKSQLPISSLKTAINLKRHNCPTNEITHYSRLMV
jgi:hypothetical protein